HGHGKVVVEAITQAEIAQGPPSPAPTSAGAATSPHHDTTLTDQLNKQSVAQLDQNAPSQPANEAAQTQAPSPSSQAPGNTLLPIPTLESADSAAIFLQFGAFSGQENAEALAKQL